MGAAGRPRGRRCVRPAGQAVSLGFANAKHQAQLSSRRNALKCIAPPPRNKKASQIARLFCFLGAAGLEPAEAGAERFTVSCNCRYATPPKNE